MDRIAIIGCGGSGKSHLARELGALLNIPVTHLDARFYDTDWNPLPHEEFAALQRELAAQPRWVMDGNYVSTLPIRLAAADTVIFCDLPAVVCLAGILERRLRHGAGQHDAVGVYNRITWGFLRYIGRYRRTMRPRVQRLLAGHAQDTTVVVLRNRRATRHYLTSLTRTSGEASVEP